MSPSSASGLHAPGEQRAATRACSWLMPALWVAGAAADGHLQVSQWQWLAPHSQDRFLLVGPPAVGVAHILLGQLRQQPEPTFRSLSCCQNPGLCLWC